MLTVERRQTITQLLKERGVVRVADLSERFDVSPSTIRRDLQKLEQQGLIERTYGGATQRDGKQPSAPDDPVVEAKNRIGRAVAKLLEPGETVFLGSGSTILAVACALSERSDLTIITSGLSVALQLAEHSQVELVVVGGLVNREGSAMTGHLTEAALANLHADRAILGVQGISTPDGLTSDHLSQVQVAQILLETVPEVIIAADHTKFGRVCTARIAPVERADLIVTDRKAPDAFLWELAELEIQVLLA